MDRNADADGNVDLRLIRMQVMIALRDCSELAGRNDNEALLAFGVCTDYFSMGGLDEIPLDPHKLLYSNPNELQALTKFARTYADAYRILGCSSELDYLKHPIYRELARMARTAYETMLKNDA